MVFGVLPDHLAEQAKKPIGERRLQIEGVEEDLGLVVVRRRGRLEGVRDRGYLLAGLDVEDLQQGAAAVALPSNANASLWIGLAPTARSSAA